MRSEALATLGSNDAEKRLKYLEEKLQLIQTNQFSKDKIHFVLEPLAEYLAAWYLVDLYLENPEQQELQKLQQQFNSIPQEVKLAVIDCFKAISKEK